MPIRGRLAAAPDVILRTGFIYGISLLAALAIVAINKQTAI
jgi:hypothetical protein